MSDSVQSHGLMHTRPPCLSPSPRICTSSCSVYWWCLPAISSSDALSSLCPWSIPESETFPTSHLFVSDDQNTRASASASLLPVSIQDWSPLRLNGFISMLFKGLSGVFSSTFGGINSLAFFLLYDATLTTTYDHWEDHSLDYIDLCWHNNVCFSTHCLGLSLLSFQGILSSDFMAAVTVCMILEPRRRKSVTTSTFSLSICKQ